MLRSRSMQMEKRHFDAIRSLLYDASRIDLKAGKETLVQNRLMGRIRALGLDSFGAYIDLVVKGSPNGELTRMVDALTTNKTSFFREDKHFDLLQKLLADLPSSTDLRIWCAACASGEEAYTLGILLHEHLPERKARCSRILATDISETALAAARSAEYRKVQLADVPPLFRHSYFALSETAPDTYTVVPKVRNIIRFASLNLMGQWPMRGPFNIIFCRNVMIYFDRPTQETLINRFYDMLPPRGYLFTSHSESMTGISHSFDYVQPGVYVR